MSEASMCSRSYLRASTDKNLHNIATMIDEILDGKKALEEKLRECERHLFDANCQIEDSRKSSVTYFKNWQATEEKLRVATDALEYYTSGRMAGIKNHADEALEKIKTPSQEQA